MQKNLSKVITVVLALTLVAAALLTACTPQDGFVYPQKPASANAIGNGGTAVTYGEYLYYVNGNETAYTVKNGYNGEVKTGDIVRIKLADLKAVLALNDDKSIASSDLADEIQKKVYESAELVVPMFYYTGNTSNKAVNGLYVFGDKLYFTTPNTALATNGNALNTELCVYCADLDGRNLTKLYTVTDNTLLIMLTEEGGVVSATYVQSGTLYNVKLTGENSTADTIAEEITSQNFDKITKSVYYVNKDGSICQYVAGSAEETVLLENTDKDYVTYTIVSFNGGYVYFTMADSRNSQMAYGVNAIKQGMSESKQILAAVPSSGTYLCYGEKVIVTGTTFASTPSAYQLYLTSGDGKTKEYIIPESTNEYQVSFSKLEGDTLIYTCNGKTYSVDLTKPTGDYVINELYTSISANGWAEVDAVVLEDETLYLAFASSGNVTVYQYKEDDKGDKKLTSTSISMIKPDEEEAD